MFSYLFRKKPTITRHNIKQRSTESQIGDFYLPDELWLNIFSHVDASDLLSLSLICNHFNDLTGDNVLWKSLAEKTHPYLRVDEHHPKLSVKEQLHRAVIKEKEQKMQPFFAKENNKKPKNKFETIDSSLSTRTTGIMNNVASGAYWTLPIFTYHAGKMIAAEPGGEYLSGLERAVGVIFFPWAVFGDLGKLPIMATYTVVNAVRFAVVAPVNLLFGGRNANREEENLYETMRYSLFAAVDGLKRLNLEDDHSLIAMSKEGHLQPLMAMVCFLIAYNSLTMEKNSLLLNETIVTRKTCPSKFLSSFERIIQLRNTMQTNLNDTSNKSMAEEAVKWVPQIWAALKSDKNYSVDNEIVQDIIYQLKDLVDMLMKSNIGEAVSARMSKRLGA